jgi:flagellum-specific peptidoglycan hydrolase FlgJ
MYNISIDNDAFYIPSNNVYSHWRVNNAEYVGIDTNYVIDTFKIVIDLENDSKRTIISKSLPMALYYYINDSIPISISLAQFILESKCGKSTMAIKSHNFFGHKCKDTSHWKQFKGIKHTEHCSYYKDDVPNNRFLNFTNYRDSWEARRNLLKLKRYKRCFDKDDYRHWAISLQKCGYATDKNYAKNLINIIETNKYHLIDETVKKRINYYKESKESINEITYDYELK